MTKDEIDGARIPIVYSANSLIFHGLVLSALSVARKCSRPIKVYVLTMELTDVNKRFTAVTEEQINKLDAALKTLNERNEAVKIDVSSDFERELLKSKNLKNNFTPYAMLRLLMDFYELPDKVIYLDVDTMCCSDICALYDVDIENYEFAAALDKVGHRLVRPRYCNSGVLYMNMKKIRETRLLERAREKVNKRRMFMPDQSALNFLAKSKLILDYRFNEQRKIKKDTVVKHFCQFFKWVVLYVKVVSIKQWERDKVHNKLKIHDFDEEYELYDKLDAIYNFKG